MDGTVASSRVIIKVCQGGLSVTAQVWSLQNMKQRKENLAYRCKVEGLHRLKSAPENAMVNNDINIINTTCEECTGYIVHQGIDTRTHTASCLYMKDCMEFGCGLFNVCDNDNHQNSCTCSYTLQCFIYMTLYCFMIQYCFSGRDVAPFVGMWCGLSPSY